MALLTTASVRAPVWLWLVFSTWLVFSSSLWLRSVSLLLLSALLLLSIGPVLRPDVLIRVADVIILQIYTLLILILWPHPLVCHPRLWPVLDSVFLPLLLWECPLISHGIDRSASFLILPPGCKVLLISRIPHLLSSLIPAHFPIDKLSIKIPLPFFTWIILPYTACPPMRIRLLFKFTIPSTLLFLPISNQMLRLHLPFLLLLPSIKYRSLILPHIPVQPQLVPNDIRTFIIILKHLLILDMVIPCFRKFLTLRHMRWHRARMVLEKVILVINLLRTTTLRLLLLHLTLIWLLEFPLRPRWRLPPEWPLLPQLFPQ